MGIICELYRISDYDIDTVREYLDDNYASVNGKYHLEDDTVFSMDKGWGIAFYLLQKADISPEKIMKFLNIDSSETVYYDENRFIKSNLVRLMNSALQNIDITTVLDFYNEEEMIKENVYSAVQKWNKVYILNHIIIIKQAFLKASECNDGIVISYG